MAGPQGCESVSRWDRCGVIETKTCARPTGHPGEHMSKLVSEWDTRRWFDDEAAYSVGGSDD